MSYYYIKDLDNGKPIGNVFCYTDSYTDARRQLVHKMTNDLSYYEKVCSVYVKHFGTTWNVWDIILGIELI